MSAVAERVRLFVALELPPPAVQAIADVQAKLQAGDEPVAARFTPPERLHLTLKFLGDQPAAEVPAICRELQAIRAAPIEAELGGLGTFGKRHPSVLWGGLESPQLAPLQQAVEAALADRAERERCFVSHITIARFRRRMPRPAVLRERIAALVVPRVQLTCREFLLKRSTLTPEGPLYHTECACPLIPNAS